MLLVVDMCVKCFFVKLLKNVVKLLVYVEKIFITHFHDLQYNLIIIIFLHYVSNIPLNQTAKMFLFRSWWVELDTMWLLELNSAYKEGSSGSTS